MRASEPWYGPVAFEGFSIVHGPRRNQEERMSRAATVAECTVIRLGGNDDEGPHSKRGKLTPIEFGSDLPFDVRRVFLLHDLPLDAKRGCHAHRSLHEGLIAISGAFTVTLDDGTSRRQVRLESPREMLHIRPLVWLELTEFTPGAVCLALASTHYDEADYVRDYPSFLNLRKEIA